MEVTEANIDSVISQLQEDMKWFEAVKKWNEQKRTVNTAHVWAMPRKGTAEHAEVSAIMSGKPQAAAAAPAPAKAAPAPADDKKARKAARAANKVKAVEKIKASGLADIGNAAAHIIIRNGEPMVYTDAHSNLEASSPEPMRKVGDTFYGSVGLINQSNEKDGANTGGEYIGVRYDKATDKFVTSFYWQRLVRKKGGYIRRLLPVETNMIVKPKGGFKMPVEISDAAKEYIKNASR